MQKQNKVEQIHCLKKIDLSNNIIEKDGVRSLVIGVERNKYIEKLNLQMNVSLPYNLIQMIEDKLKLNREWNKIK